MPNVKDEFKNESPGYIGVVTVNDRHERTPIAVAPGDTVWLSEEEQVLTANAPRSEANNPLTNGSLRLVSEGREIRHRRDLRPPVAPEPEVEAEEETGAAPQPAGDPEEGKRAPNEEVGTPEAAKASGAEKRRPVKDQPQG
jgi:hypothetical protein